MATIYKCPNVGNCSKANSGEAIPVPGGADTRCPECQAELFAASDGEGSSADFARLARTWAIPAAGLAALTAGLAIFFGSRPEPPPAASPPASESTPALPTVEPPAPSPAPAVKAETPSRPSALAQQYVSQGTVYVSLAKQNPKSKQENLSLAIEKFDRAIEADGPNSCFAQAYMDRGLAQLFLGKPNKAEQDLEKAVACDPKSPTVHYNFAAFYSLEDKLDLALEQLDLALAAGFSDCEALRRDSDLAKLRKSSEFRIILERHKMFCL